MSDIENNDNQESQAPTQAQLDQLAQEKESLLNKNKELLGDISSLKDLKRTIEELGGVETIKSVFDERKQAEQKHLEENNSVDQLKQHYTTEIEKERKEKEQLIQGIVDQRVETELKTAVSKEKGSYDLLEHKLRKHIQAEYVDGKVQMKVMDENGMPLLVDGKEAGLSDLVKNYKQNETFARAFDGTANIQGSGAPVGGTVGTKSSPESLQELTELYRKNPAQALEYMKAKGLA